MKNIHLQLRNLIGQIESAMIQINKQRSVANFQVSATFLDNVDF